MPLQIECKPYTLRFSFEAGTSRGIMTHKTSWFVKIFDTQTPEIFGLGECGLLAGLSLDDRPHYETIIKQFCQDFNDFDLEIFDWNIPIILDQIVGSNWPSIRCGFEMAMLDFLNGGQRIVFNNNFVKGQPIAINGLVWMGDTEFMLAQIEEKLAAGFKVLKMKVGAIDFEQECKILASIRQRFSANDIELRVDANGAFSPDDVAEKLKQLSDYELHSIEQPIKPKHRELMAKLCQNSPIPIALDEELIGQFDYGKKRTLLKELSPQYIILKPSLIGGFQQSREWIETAQRLDIGWWVTSALESNVGLNAIAQFTAEFNNPLPQGLGTGQLYDNNIASPMKISNGALFYDITQKWDLNAIL